MLNVTEVTLPEWVGWTFMVTRRDHRPYVWELDGALQPAGADPNDFYDFPAHLHGYLRRRCAGLRGGLPGGHLTVAPSGVGVEMLSITPLSAVVMPGGTVAFTAFGGDGIYSFSATDGGIIDNANPATYVRPRGRHLCGSTWRTAAGRLARAPQWL